ncbi:hypothetical protein [Gemmatimonas groenlandica]|uniref:Uncharacterized protein n=1 Tax=Gemmatimonas groenlandica TaxID=2732249 RepID=A0A6M4IWB8_9BACT|nr:hypothetical protein [Gemmatimonas groenlandica]QJR37182.1 hypothetical protein HKW67_17490 [Gemmatimonas groenlandica]
MAATSLGLLTLAACGGGSDGITDPGTNGGTPPAGPTTTLTFTPCATAGTSPVVWVGYQDGTTGTWKQATKVGSSYEMKFASAKGAAAITEEYAPSHETYAYYGTVDELQASLTYSCSSQTPTTVQVKGLQAGQIAGVSLGFNSAYMYGPGDQSSNLNARSGTTTLLAVLGKTDTAVTKMVLRRGISPIAPAPVDFSATEAFSPVTGSLRFLGEAPRDMSMWYRTADARHQMAYGLKPKSGTVTLFGLPDDRRQPGELYEFYTYYDPQLVSGTTFLTRGSQGYVSSIANVEVPAFETLTMPTNTVASTTGYLRLRTTFTAPATLKSFYVGISGDTDDNSFYTYFSRAYLTGTALDLTTPNFTGVAGWNNGWAPRTGQNGRISTGAASWSANDGGYFLKALAGNIGFNYSWSGKQPL